MTYYTYKFTWYGLLPFCCDPHMGVSLWIMHRIILLEPRTNRRPATSDTKSVVVTGNFDNWLQTDGVLTRDHFGNFEADVKLPALDTILFKFVVDGKWVTSLSYKTAQDEFGNNNNYLDVAELTAVEEFVEEPEEPEEQTARDESAGSEPEPVVADDVVEEKLTQVLTSESSYAAVSIPASSDSAFEHVSDISHEESSITDAVPPGTDPDKPSCRNAPEDITPTNSRAGRPLDAEGTTLGGHSCDSSISGRPLQPDSEAVALSPVLARGKGPRRREGLIIRLKSIFR